MKNSDLSAMPSSNCTHSKRNDGKDDQVDLHVKHGSNKARYAAMHAPSDIPEWFL